jgi:hypothetical protein
MLWKCAELEDGSFAHTTQTTRGAVDEVHRIQVEKSTYENDVHAAESACIEKGHSIARENEVHANQIGSNLCSHHSSF